MIRRYVINGTPGSGKSTLLYGRGDSDSSEIHYPCLKDLGYTVFGDTIGKVLTETVAQGKNPLEHGAESLELIMKEEIENFLSVKEGVAFFDKGLPYYEGVAKKMGVAVPEDFYGACKKFRYDDPIITLELIEDYDLTDPKNAKSRTRAFTVDERKEMDGWFEQTFKQQVYTVVRIPLFGKNLEESINLRLEEVQKILEI